MPMKEMLPWIAALSFTALATAAGADGHAVELLCKPEDPKWGVKYVRVDYGARHMSIRAYNRGNIGGDALGTGPVEVLADRIVSATAAFGHIRTRWILNRITAVLQEESRGLGDRLNEPFHRDTYYDCTPYQPGKPVF